jgi:hypothetical protein
MYSKSAVALVAAPGTFAVFRAGPMSRPRVMSFAQSGQRASAATSVSPRVVP